MYHPHARAIAIYLETHIYSSAATKQFWKKACKLLCFENPKLFFREAVNTRRGYCTGLCWLHNKTGLKRGCPRTLKRGLYQRGFSMQLCDVQDAVGGRVYHFGNVFLVCGCYSFSECGCWRRSQMDRGLNDAWRHMRSDQKWTMR